MRTYPLMLNLQGKRVVVVGGGTVGTRKVRELLAAGADVTVVDHGSCCDSPADGVKPLTERYRPEHLEGAAVVFACTDDREMNARIAADARQLGALVNAADQPEDCDFFVPATAGDHDVVVAVGTGGASPALAGRLARLLSDALPARVGEYAAALADIRRRLLACDTTEADRRRILIRLAGEEGHRAFLDGGVEALKKLAEETLEDG